MNKQTRKFTFYGILTIIVGIATDLNLSELLTKSFNWITLMYFISGIVFTTYFYLQVMETLNEDTND